MPTFFTIVVVLGALALGGAAVGSALEAEPAEPLLVAALSAAALLLGGAGVTAARLRFTLTEEGIVSRGWAGERHVAYDALLRARYRPVAKRLELEIRGGGSLRFSALLRGLDELACELAARAPHLEMDDATRRVLAAARKGHLPPVWG